MLVSHLPVLANFLYLDNFRYDCKTIFLSVYETKRTIISSPCRR